ncbi:hypothetical protein GKE82_17100 [Conexibacter sp. W3-3-2]|uniref:hypothetical protein n=1 Tax=Conexibacter sp. W3-3-2 TaxID=2675227 RepID=UPI0012B9C770|nr:hypothetical protein [Conexibacter sp. W3-3-2]MTD45958.1 hypothetical protein [Conexibacter sp. W3-3-2]
MRAEQFDDYVTALARGLRASGVEFLLLEDDDIDSITVVPGPSRRNLDRLVRALQRMNATGRVPGERETLPVDYDHLLRCGPSRWPMRVDGADTDIMVVDVADGRYGRYYESSRRVEIEPGLAVDVVPDAPIMTPRRADATDVLPELSTMSQRERDMQRLKRRAAAAKAERRAARSGRIAPVPVLSGPRTFANLRRPH